MFFGLFEKVRFRVENAQKTDVWEVGIRTDVFERQGYNQDMTKILFFDIDGTLFTNDFRLPATVRPALMKAREHGCKIYINTGRTLCNIDKKLQELPLDGISMGCGCRVIAEGQTLISTERSHEESMKIVDVYRRNKVPTVYESDTGMYFDSENTDDDMIQDWREYTDKRGLTRFVDEEGFKAVKMFSKIPDEDDVGKLMDDLKDAGFDFYPRRRSRDGYEIGPEGYTKATGIDMVREFYGVGLEDCYVFGDSENDLSMLRHVPNSVAMGQSPEEVKKCCSFVTDTPENDGIEKALMGLGLIPRK